MTSTSRTTGAGLGVGLLISLSVLLPATAAAEPAVRPVAAVVADARPATGANVVRRGGGGAGVLRIDNGTADDAVVSLSHGTRAVRAVYVRGRDVATVRGIADGTYDVYVTFGSAWSSGERVFTGAPRYAQFDRPARFTTRRVSGGTEYTSYRTTLQPVDGGTVALRDVPPAAYPR